MSEIQIKKKRLVLSSVSASTEFVGTNSLRATFPETPRKGAMYIARKRNHRIHFRYGEDEKKIFDKIKKENGMPKATFLRFLIMYAILIETPPIDFEGIGESANRIGRKINDILYKAAHSQFVNPKEIEKLFSELEKIETVVDKNFDFDKWYAYHKEAKWADQIQ